MAQNSGFFDSTYVVEDVNGFPKGDKAQDAAFWARLNKTFYSDGVAKTSATSFQVTADGESGGRITVNPGECLIRGYIAFDDEAEYLEIPFSESAQEFVVAQRLDLTTAAGAGITKMLLPSSGYPTRSDTVYDIWLARVTVPGGTVHIDQSMITDLRGDQRVCGWIYAPLAKAQADAFPDFVQAGATQIARTNGGTGEAYTAEVELFDDNSEYRAVRIVPVADSLPSATLQVNSAAAYPIVLPGGRAVGNGDLKAGVPVDVTFYGGNFYLQSGTVVGDGTALPASGTPLVGGMEYRVADEVGTYAFTFPTGNYEIWLRFTVASTFNISFPSGTKFLGAVPEFEAGGTYEMSVKDGVVVVGQAVTE